MAKRGWLLALLFSLPLAAVVLCLGACLPVGVGDPETSKVDPALVGVWEEIRDDGTPKGSLVVAVPFDGRAYLLRTAAVERAADGIKVKPGDEHYKAWLTAIEGRTFVTAQPLAIGEGDELPGFLVARVEPSEDGKKLTATLIHPDFAPLAPLKRLPAHMSYAPPAEGEKAPSEDEARALLRRIIAENVGNEELYAASATYRRVTDEAVLSAVSGTVTRSARAHFNLGTWYAQRGQAKLGAETLALMGEAAVHMGRAVEIRPDHIAARVSLGRVCKMLGRDEDARAQWEEALRLAKPMRDPPVDPGQIAMFLGRYDEAIEIYDDRLRRRLRPTACLSGLMICHKYLGSRAKIEDRPDAAATHFRDALGAAEKLLLQKPLDGKLLLDAAELAEWTGDRQRAAELRVRATGAGAPGR